MIRVLHRRVAPVARCLILVLYSNLKDHARHMNISEPQDVVASPRGPTRFNPRRRLQIAIVFLAMPSRLHCSRSCRLWFPCTRVYRSIADPEILRNARVPLGMHDIQIGTSV